MSKSKCCGWRDPKITRQGDILMIADRKSSIPRPYCMTCGRSCEIIPESAVDTAPASDATEGTGETSPPKPSEPIELDTILTRHLQEIKAGHDQKLKAELLEWVKSLLPEKRELVISTVSQEPREFMTSEREIKVNNNHQAIGYNKCISDILTILESEKQ